VYPNSFWLPETGMQRGSLLIVDGDPQTPNYPSIEGVYTEDLDYVKDTYLPKIPCQPVFLGDLGTQCFFYISDKLNKTQQNFLLLL
jgi:hypothetical protein